jgi:hypothetical protein
MYSTLPITWNPFRIDGRPNVVELFPGSRGVIVGDVRSLLNGYAGQIGFSPVNPGDVVVEMEEQSHSGNDQKIAVYSCINSATRRQCFVAGLERTVDELRYVLPITQNADLTLIGRFENYTKFVDAIHNEYIRVFESEYPTISYGILNSIFSTIAVYFINPTLWAGTLNLVNVCVIVIAIGVL